MENMLDEEYYNFNKQLAQRIYDSGFNRYRWGDQVVPENVEELNLDAVPTYSEGRTWHRKGN